MHFFLHKYIPFIFQKAIDEKIEIAREEREKNRENYSKVGADPINKRDNIISMTYSLIVCEI